MFEKQIKEMWEDWYQKEKPKKMKYAPWMFLSIIIMIISPYLAFVSVYWLIGFFGSMLVMGVLSCKVTNAEHKLIHSALEYSWQHQVYDTGRGKTFPFLHTNQEYVMGGKTFHYENVDVIFYDTHYASQRNEPGIVIEVIPLYKIGPGKPIQKKKQVTVPQSVGLDERIILFMNKIISTYCTYKVGSHWKREEDKFYLYLMWASMGLVVRDDGTLRNSALGKGADDAARIMDACLGERIEKCEEEK